jgi:tetratricopeptide (TPR) repeat protein
MEVAEMRKWPWIAVLAVAILVAGCASTADKETKAKEAVKYYKRGVELYKQKRIDEGITTMRKGLEIQPDYVKLRRDLAKALYWRGEVAEIEYLNRQARATQLLDKGRKKESTKELQKAQGSHRKASVDYNEAMGHFQVVRSVWPQEAMVVFYMARIYVFQGELEKAKEHFEMCLEIGRPTRELRERLLKAIKLVEEEMAKRDLKENSG